MATATKPQPRPGATRVCPGCARRDTMIVDPQCPICDGQGVLHLAPLVHYPDDVIAEAVEVALEAAAREVIARSPAAVLTGEAADALRVRVGVLRSMKILATKPTPRDAAAPRVRDRNTAAVRVATWTGSTPTSEDLRVLSAPPVEWLRTRRPLERGGIPGFSMGGYVCALARAVDPVDPLSQPVLGFGPGRRKRSEDASSLALFAVDAYDRTHGTRTSA